MRAGSLQPQSLPPPGEFRAAVYEHELVLPTSCSARICTRKEAIELMEINLSVLEEQVVEAARQGANIILLPEDGRRHFDLRWSHYTHFPSTYCTQFSLKIYI